MIDARKARETTNEVVDNQTTSEMAGIEKAIAHAVSEGEYSITVNSLSKNADAFLRKNGYKVTYHSVESYRDESYFTISW